MVQNELNSENVRGQILCRLTVNHGKEFGFCSSCMGMLLEGFRKKKWSVLNFSVVSTAAMLELIEGLWGICMVLV